MVTRVSSCSFYVVVCDSALIAFDLRERLEYTGQGRDEEVGFISVGTEATLLGKGFQVKLVDRGAPSFL